MPDHKTKEQERQEAVKALQRIADGVEEYTFEEIKKALDVWHSINREMKTHDKKEGEK